MRKNKSNSYLIDALKDRFSSLDKKYLDKKYISVSLNNWKKRSKILKLIFDLKFEDQSEYTRTIH